MLSFENIHLTDELPIYLQLIRYVKEEIAAGHVAMSEEMPSRRILSSLLGVNPNTIQKAYRCLEEEGIIESHAGAKSYVVTDEGLRRKIRQELLREDTLRYVTCLKKLDISKEEAAVIISELWEADK